MSEKTAAQTAYERWYAKHKEEHNAKRRARYQDDPEYRERARAGRRNYGRRQREEQGDGVTREVGGQMVQCYRVGYVSELLGRPISAIRDWEKRNWIPRPTIEGTHRCYTEHQVELLLELNEALNEAGTSRLAQRHVKQTVAEKLKAEWGLA